MGAWGHNSFENDTAGDWIWALKPADDPFAYPMSAIDELLKSDLYIDATECAEAIAAAECLAAAQGHPPENPPEYLEKWLASLGTARPTPDMLNRATEAINKVRKDEQSELRQLWQDTDDFKDWQAAIDDLLTRLTQNP